MNASYDLLAVTEALAGTRCFYELVVWLGVSVVAAVIFGYYFFTNYVFLRHFHREKKRSSILMLISLFVAIWMLRMAVGRYICFVGSDDYDGLNGLEEFFNAAIHGLQSFSMDEDYTTYQRCGKEMVCALTGNNPICLWVYIVWSMLLNVSAPIAAEQFYWMFCPISSRVYLRSFSSGTERCISAN